MKPATKKIVIFLAITLLGLFIILFTKIFLLPLPKNGIKEKARADQSAITRSEIKINQTSKIREEVVPAEVKGSGRLYFDPSLFDLSIGKDMSVMVKLDVDSNAAYIVGAHIKLDEGLTVNSCAVDSKYTAAPGYADCAYDNEQKTIDLALQTVSGEGAKGISSLAAVNISKSQTGVKKIGFISGQQQVFVRLSDGSAVKAVVATDDGSY